MNPKPLRLLYGAALVFAACAVEGHLRTFDPETGRLLSDHYFKVEIEATEVRLPSGVLVKVGDATDRSTNVTYEVYDSNDDGSPDLARDPATNKFYKLSGWQELDGQRMSSSAHFLCDVYRNDPSVRLSSYTGPYTGDHLLELDGSNAVTRAGGGETRMKNTIVYDFTPAADPLDSMVRIGIRQSSAWKLPDFTGFPDLRYEILAAPSPDKKPWLLVAHVEGPLWQVALWMVQRGTLKFWFKTPAQMAPEANVMFERDPNVTGQVNFFVNDKPVGSVR